MTDQELEAELAQNVMGIIQKARAGDLAPVYVAHHPEDRNPPTDDQLAAAAIVEMCRQAFTGEWDA